MTEQGKTEIEIFSTLDVRNMTCSKPLIKIKVQLKKMKPSETLEVIAGKNNYKDLVRLFGETQGHHIQETHKGNQVRLLITKA